MDFNALFQSFATKKVTIVGDVMLDTYWWGHVERISPEAPVPVVTVDRKEYRIGGAGNVALNLVALGAKTTILSVIGKDMDGKILKDLLKENHINTKYLVETERRITTNKIRIMGRNQQMMRLDAEIIEDLDDALTNSFLEHFINHIESEMPDVVILEDYNKGILTTKVIEQIISLCKEKNILTTVDPKRKNFFAYKGVDMFKPNLKEVMEGLNLLMEKIDLSFMRMIHQQLHEKLQHSISFITLSEKGVFYESNHESALIPSHIRKIADVSGAGDTVIAVASLVYATTKDMNLTATIANIAGGLVCETLGTTAIDKSRLLEECLELITTE